MPAGRDMLRRALSVVILAAFLGWVMWYVSSNAAAFRPVLRVSWQDSLNLTLAFLAIMAGNGLFIGVVSRAFGIRLLRLEWLSLSFASSFANYFLPFRGGTGVRALYMYRLHGFPIAEFVSTLSIMYLMYCVVNGLLAVAGMIVVAVDGGPLDIALIAFFALVALAGMVVMLLDVDLRSDFERFPLAQLARLAWAWRTVRSNRALVVKCWLLMIAMTVATVWQCRTAFGAVSVDLPWAGVCVYAAARNLATLIGLTPGALGIVEVVSIYLGKVLGYTTAEALSVQALIRAVAIVSLLLLGPVALVYLRRRLVAVPASGAETADA